MCQHAVQLHDEPATLAPPMEPPPAPQAPLTVWKLYELHACGAQGIIAIISELTRWQEALAVEREHDPHVAIATAH